MNIIDFLLPSQVYIDFKAQSKDNTLKALAALGHSLTGLDENHILSGLSASEQAGTTVVGHGVAIPNTKLHDLDQPSGIFATLKAPIHFDSVDDELVDLIFMLLGPMSLGHIHLKALARITRLLRDPTMCAKLRGSTSSDAMYALLTAS